MGLFLHRRNRPGHSSINITAVNLQFNDQNLQDAHANVSL
jgi:hypothetical protein